MKVLAFSGGKDSLACWYLKRDEINAVMWANTGKAYPETLGVVDRVRQECGELGIGFVEVNTDQAAQNERNGIPSDVVPIAHTVGGMQITGQRSVMVQSYLQCCWENISKPLNDAARELGAKYVIRGQRNDDEHRPPCVDGQEVEGITYLHPIADWSTPKVLAFLREQMGELPEHFRLEHSSMDCYDCTAFAEHSGDRVQWMKERHPEMYRGYAARAQALLGSLMPGVEALDRILERP